MTWNYRIVRDDNGLAFREVYYNKRGKIDGWTEREVCPRAESIRQLQEFIDGAMSKPILIEKDGKLVETDE